MTGGLDEKMTWHTEIETQWSLQLYVTWDRW